jgi:hypothetical protein
MTNGSSPLAPEAALGWLRSLSVDIREAAVLDAAGAVLAGDRALASAVPARRVIVVASQGHGIAVRHGRRALEGLLRADMEAALEALERP